MDNIRSWTEEDEAIIATNTDATECKRCADSTQAVGNFIELDFPTVTARKCQIIKRNKQLLEKIANEDGEVIIRSGDLHADGYHLAACDLRSAASVRRALAASSWSGAAPTLLLASRLALRAPPSSRTWTSASRLALRAPPSSRTWTSASRLALRAPPSSRTWTSA
ncbi:Leucine carboxyl methyltransferase 1 protein, partial [Operophtera brumata]